MGFLMFFRDGVVGANIKKHSTDWFRGKSRGNPWGFSNFKPWEVSSYFFAQEQTVLIEPQATSTFSSISASQHPVIPSSVDSYYYTVSHGILLTLPPFLGACHIRPLFHSVSMTSGVILIGQIRVFFSTAATGWF